MVCKSSRKSNRNPSTGVAIAIAALISTPAWANATECTNGGLTRSIEVVYSNPGHAVPCEVIYDKSAEGAGQHSLWRADSEAGYCEAQAAAFVDKLTGFGWTCGAAPAAAAKEPAAPEEEPAAAAKEPAAVPDEAPAAPQEEPAVELLGEGVDDAPA